MCFKLKFTVSVFLLVIIKLIQCGDSYEIGVQNEFNSNSSETHQNADRKESMPTIQVPAQNENSIILSSLLPAPSNATLPIHEVSDHISTTQHTLTISPSIEGLERRERDVSSECWTHHYGVYMPSYSMYLIGFAMLFMFLVIIYLIFILQKFRTNNTQTQTFVRQDSCVSAKGHYNRQISGERSPGIKTGMSIPLIACEEIKIEDSMFTPSNTRDINQNATSTTSLNRPKILSQSIRNHVHPNPILPEQMKRICEEALEKKNSLNNNGTNTASNEISQMISDIELRPNNYSRGLIREKSASVPQLDVYDTLPSPVATKELNEAKMLDEASSNDESVNYNKQNSSNDKFQSDCDENQVDYDDIYDCPPSAKKPTIVEDANYMFPIANASSKSDLSDPSYINAKSPKFIL